MGHGKTTLAECLSGLADGTGKADKVRGRTIEASVAPLGLADDLVATLIDVPGHERYLKNTVRGLCGAKMAVLVVAADDGVMPRTLEHLRILEFLGVENGFAVLSKCDLVDEETVELAQLEIREAVEGTFLESSAIIPYSAGDEDAVSEILSEMERVGRQIGDGSDEGPFRLWIDRICGFSGHGTVVCGTVRSGRVREGDALELLPGNLKTRARSLEIHRGKVQGAVAGQQVGVNIPKTPKKSVGRGMLLSAPDGLEPTRFLNGILRISENAVSVLPNHGKVLLYIGTCVSFARAVFMECDAMGPGEEGLVQFRLPESIPALPGDRFVVTPHCEKKVLGGGTILEVSPFKFRGARARQTLGYLKALAKDDLVGAALAYANYFPYRPSRIDEIARYCCRSEKQVREAVRENQDCKKAMPVGDNAFFPCDRFEALKEQIAVSAESLLEQDLLKEVVNPEELRGRLSLQLDKALFQKAMESLQEEDMVVRDGTGYRFPGLAVRLSGSRKALSECLIEYGDERGWAPFTANQFQEDSSSRTFSKSEIAQVAGYLVKKKRLIRLGDGRLLTPKALEMVKERVKESVHDTGEFTLADSKNILGFGRSKGSMIFEYLDEIGFTRRDGNRRVIV